MKLCMPVLEVLAVPGRACVVAIVTAITVMMLMPSMILSTTPLECLEQMPIDDAVVTAVSMNSPARGC